MQKWEYHIEHTWTNKEKLDRLGKEGWELVSATIDPHNNAKCTYIFKRPLKD